MLVRLSKLRSVSRGRHKYLSLLCSCTLAICVLFCVDTALFAEQSSDLSYALELGEKALQNNDITLSTMYFANALGRNPGAMPVIKRYVDVVTNWALSKEARDPMGYLEYLDDLLSSQVPLISPAEIPELLELMEKVAETRERVMSELEPSSKEGENAPSIEGGALSADEIKKKVQEARTISEHLQILKGFIDSSGLSGEENTNVTYTYELGMAVHTLIAQAKELIKFGMEEKTDFQLYYLNSAESAIQQAVTMSINLPGIYTVELKNIRKELLKGLAIISRNQSQEALDAVLHLCPETYVRPSRRTPYNTKAATALNAINEFLQKIRVFAPKITESDHAATFSEVISAAQSAELYWRELQLTRYNQWAVKNVQDFIDAVKKDDAFYKRKDKGRITVLLKNRFGDIDTRLLNYGAMQCYTEVFTRYFNDIDEEQRIEVGRALAFLYKKKLDDF